jgi:nucleoid-associated protein YgaU
MITMPKRTKQTEAAVTDTTEKPKGRKQGELPGMEAPKIPELDTLLEQYAEKTSALSALRVDVGQLKVNIIQTAEKHGVTVYRDETADPPLLLTITERDVAVKVKPVGGDVEPDEEHDE